MASTLVTAAATSADPIFNGLDAANVAVSNSDNEVAAIVTIAPLTLAGQEAETETYTITLSTPLSSETVLVTATFDPAQLQVAGSSTGTAMFTFNATTTTRIV